MLTPEQVAQYHDEGYTLAPEVFTRYEVDELLAEVQALTAAATVANHDATRLEMEPNQGPEGKKVRRLYEPCTYYPRFRSLSEEKKLLDALEQLVGPNLLFHLSKINMKPAKLGSVVDWHQDLAYYPMTNSDSVTVLVYFDDADASNGCLQVIPRVHRERVLDHTWKGFFQGRVTETVDTSKAVFLEGKAGSAIFLHGLAPHASAPNLSSKPRTTLIMAYRAADAFPIHLSKRTAAHEPHERVVRGQESSQARFGQTSFPIPRYPIDTGSTSSLYDLQELYRKGQAAPK